MGGPWPQPAPGSAHEVQGAPLCFKPCCRQGPRLAMLCHRRSEILYILSTGLPVSIWPWALHGLGPCREGNEPCVESRFAG